MLIVLMIAGWVVRRAVRALDALPPQVVRRSNANVRNGLLLASVGLMMNWEPQLRTLALSLKAIAVAVVVATRELLLCLSGSALRTFISAYAIGDYVEIGAFKGEVIDISLLATRLR